MISVTQKCGDAGCPESDRGNPKVHFLCDAPLGHFRKPDISHFAGAKPDTSHFAGAKPDISHFAGAKPDTSHFAAVSEQNNATVFRVLFGEQSKICLSS